MMKKIIFLVFFMVGIAGVFADVNPLNDYISIEDYKVGTQKFNDSKNIFKESDFDRSAIIRELMDTEIRVKSVFTQVLTSVNKDGSYSAVVYYTDPAISTSRRIVVTGKTAVRINGYNYYLIPNKNGIKVKDIRTGNYYKLGIKGR